MKHTNTIRFTYVDDEGAKEMILHDYRTGEAIRLATIEGWQRCCAAAADDGGRGVIEIDERSVYVEGDPDPDDLISFHREQSRASSSAKPRAMTLTETLFRIEDLAVDVEQLGKDISDSVSEVVQDLMRIARALARAVVERRIDCCLDEVADLAHLAGFGSIKDAASLDDPTEEGQ